MTVHRAGPFCGSLLADMGAEVVTIERPDVGDLARTQGVGPENRAAYFMVHDRNETSVELDLKTDAGREAARNWSTRNARRVARRRRVRRTGVTCRRG